MDFNMPVLPLCVRPFRRTTALLVLAAILLASSSAVACTNFLVTAGASVDGSTMITYTADSHSFYGELYYRPPGEHAPGTMIPIYEWDTGKYLGEIEQAPVTYSVVGNMNEHQVTIGETTFGGRESARSRRDHGLRQSHLRHAAAGTHRARGDRDHGLPGRYLRLLQQGRDLLDRRSRRGLDHGPYRQGTRRARAPCGWPGACPTATSRVTPTRPASASSRE